jgi:protocatechuate 3,4-dioxygenase beta subunit
MEPFSLARPSWWSDGKSPPVASSGKGRAVMRDASALSRRKLLALGVAAAAVPGSAARASLLPTPRQTAGPFYPEVEPLDADADLVRVAGQGEAAKGTPTHVLGRVLDRGGHAIASARVEIWQCDAFGIYHHPLDSAHRGRAADPTFQGYGRTTSGEDGSYRFRTIRPVAYPGRTPHIHFAVTAPDGASLITQMYVAGEPLNETDVVLGRIRDPAERARVIVPLTGAGPGEPGELIGLFDIVLGA